MNDDSTDARSDALHIRGARRRFGGRAEPSMLLAIAIGGALGTLGRYELNQIIHVAKDSFPWATFVENVSGAFVLGAFVVLATERLAPNPYARPFFAIGFLGSFTTFSTMAVETVTLVKDHYPVLGIGYLLASVAAGLAAGYAGIVFARRVPFGGRARNR